MFGHRDGFLLASVALLTTALLLAACGGGPAPAPTQPPAVAPPSGDLQERIGDSFNRTMGVEETVLDSFHIEARGTDPKWNEDTEQVEIETWTMTADVSGDDVYLLYTSATGDEEAETTEGYIIDGDSAEGGKEYEVVNGKLEDSFFIGLAWVAWPLDVVMPLAIASTGPTPQGEEVIDGRPTDKYGVDSANAPPGAMGILGELFTITSSRGTVWVDKDTGALLKATLDFEQKLIHPPGSDTEVGTGRGHVEVLVTKVGQVTVKLPQ